MESRRTRNIQHTARYTERAGQVQGFLALGNPLKADRDQPPL